MSEQVLEQELILSEKTEGHRVILFNDHVNSFDYVIDTLVEVCEHDPIQAEQCSNIVHYKGKCDVKSGDKRKLIPICNELLRRGLTAELS
ncbi:MAG: ATP-dependent Clp protease adaptor protein ClpS [Salibacteraceae bacterium]|jgi:ATP-dependent Clp protease adaptor protein ClpS|tara:strand:- start:405 stop:674 length:270 start_codon:yes stop_codon:yes gene_type:complete